MVGRKRSPPTVRRRSVSRPPVDSSVPASPPRSQARESDQFDEFADGVREMLVRQYKMLISAYLSKIAGADDPDYPRAEIVQQMKQTAAAMFTASSMACVAKCDVPDDSPLIMYCFAVGMRALVSETLRAMGSSEEGPDWICDDVRKKFLEATTEGTPFSFAEVEKFVDNVVANVPGLHDHFAGRPVNPIQPRPGSPIRPNITPTRHPITLPLPQPATPSGQTTFASLSPPRFTAGSPERVAVSPSRPIPNGTPARMVPGSPERPQTDDINGLVRQVMHHMGKVGRIGGEFVKTTALMDKLTEKISSEIASLRETRKRQHFSQSSQLFH